MNKNYIFIGLGVLAVGGLAFYLMRKPSAATTTPVVDAGSGADLRSADVPVGEQSMQDLGIGTGASAVPQSRKERRQERRANRRDCRAEAKALGLRGKAKRDFKKECKAAGGIDNMDEADFAFNGFDGDFE